MNATSIKLTDRGALSALIWLPSLTVAVMYALAWSHLPQTASFGFPDRPDRWATRGEHLVVSLVIMSSLAVLGTAALSCFTEPGFDTYAVLGFFYVMEWAQLYVNYQVISLNSKGVPIAFALVLITSICASVAVIAHGLRRPVLISSELKALRESRPK